LSRQTFRPGGGGSGIPGPCNVPKIQAPFLVWAGSDRRKTLQQREIGQRISRQYGLPFEIARAVAGRTEKSFSRTSPVCSRIVPAPSKATRRYGPRGSQTS